MYTLEVASRIKHLKAIQIKAFITGDIEVWTDRQKNVSHNTEEEVLHIDHAVLCMLA